MRRALATGLLLVALGTADCSGPATLEDFGPVGDFSLTERSGRTVRPADLAGKVWVASFVFTRCTGPCPQVTANVARLQALLADQPNVCLVTFTVDPDHDDPEELKKYAEHFGADPDRWLFLTGPREELYRLIREGFRLPVEQTEGEERTPGNEVRHSSRLAVVDRRGHVRGYFEGLQVDSAGQPVDEVPQAAAAVRTLLHERPSESALPAVNASLNAASAVLLLAGYLAVRARRIFLHKTCMLAALLVSVVFLASYLYLHIVIRKGEPTRFDGPAAVRSVYLVVLVSHTVLAAVAAPLALAVAYLGLRERLAMHRRIARWTLPIWLYVSVTGVVVYWMLYRLYPPT